MTISSTDNRSGPYTGTGSLDTYDIDFYFDENDDLLVTQEDTSGNITKLTLTTDYTVVGAGASSPPRNITLVAGNLTTGYKLTITRNVDATQGVDLGEGDSFPSATVEGALDKLTMLVQQLLEVAERTIVLAATTDTTTVSTNLPAPQADYVLGWNSAGTALANIAPAASSAAAAAASAAAAAASAASINLPSISSSNAGSSLEVNSGGIGYDLVTQMDRFVRYSIFKDAFL